MGEDEVDQVLPGWQVVSQAVARELAEWRRVHPKATLTEIEDAAFEAMQKLQARALGQVVHASAVTDVAAQPSDEWPRCPACGGQLAYFTKRLAQVQYAAFQAAGYPIGSGSTESANKIVVEARLKGSGMHWARAHVDPLLALRTVACANRWSVVWPSISARLRIEAEQRRRSRRRARHPTPTPTLAAVAVPRAAVTATQPSPTATSVTRRGKSIINGRPTPLHPWKRYGYDRRSPVPRDLRFPG